MVNVNTPFSQLPVVVSIDGSEVIALDQGGTTKQATLDQAINGAIQTNFPGAMAYVMDAGSGTLVIGLQGVLEAPFPFTINFIDVFLSGVGTFTIDVLKCTYADYDAGVLHPVLGDSILGGTLPTIVADTKTRVSYGNVPSADAYDVIGFYITNTAGVSKATISLNITRTIP